MLEPKEKQILQHLYKNKDSFITSKDLAVYMNCSDRTVRTYVKSLDEKLSDIEGIDIIAKQGYGYHLNVISDYSFNQLVSVDNSVLAGEAIDINDRHNFILNKLIFEQEELLFEDLMDTLFVSRSTLSSDFKKIRHDLEKYHLKIESRANKGVYVSGTEHDKRHFIMDYFFSGQFLQNIHHYIGDDFLQLPISFEELTIIVLDECRSGGLKLSDFVIQNLIVHIALAISRVKSGFTISKLNIDKNRFMNEIKVANNILNRVRYVTDITFPDEEVDYIALHLISDSALGVCSDDVDQNRLRQDLLVATSIVDDNYGYQFSQDFTLIEGLLPHLEVLLERLRNDIHLDNPLLNDIIDQYKEAFLISRSLVSHLEFFKGYHLSNDEIAYVALHVMAAMERFSQNRRLNALVICATGYGSAQMLRTRLENELGGQLNIVDLVGYYDISNDKLKNIDVIISTIDLSNLVFTIPVFTVSVFLKPNEVKLIKEELSLLGGKNSTQRISQQLDLEETFDRYFSEKYFIQVSESIDKEDVKLQIVTAFSEDCKENYVSSMLDLIKTRESMSTVIFDKDIAVPHPIKAVDKEGKIGVVIIRNGLYWENDFKNIRLVFLVSPSIYSNEGLSDLTKVMVALTENDEWKEKLIASNNFSEFKKIFLNK